LQEIKIFIFSQNRYFTVSETQFISKSYYHISGYSLYHTIHFDGKPHGGTALIVRSDIKHYEIGKYQREFLQANSIAVEDRKDCITISVVYLPPKYDIRSGQYITFFKTLHNRFIVGRMAFGIIMPNI
jgi:exonuclease III